MYLPAKAKCRNTHLAALEARLFRRCDLRLNGRGGEGGDGKRRGDKNDLQCLHDISRVSLYSPNKLYVSAL